ncbi:MAG: 30S ribosomal protein S20 [Candidatus Paceibacterota bacterium]|jgi:small subunit ribosomal protein S20
MAITSSAKKALRASERKRIFNLRSKASIEKAIKAFRKLVKVKDKDGAMSITPTLYKALDKAAKTGYIKKNTASRLKSRAMASLNKLN